jgi:hypothetical protein
MKRIFVTAAAILLASIPAFGQPNGKSPSGPIDHQESRNGRQQPNQTQESQAMSPDTMTEIARLLRQMNVIIQKTSDTLEHKESLDQAKMMDVSRIMAELSDMMRQIAGQVSGRTDAAGLQGLRTRMDELYAGMAEL